MRERVHEEGGAVEHGHEGHSAAGAVVRGGDELGSGRGRRRGGGRSGWGGGSVDRGRWRPAATAIAAAQMLPN